MLQEEATSRLNLLPVKQRGAVLAGCLSEQNKLLMSGDGGAGGPDGSIFRNVSVQELADLCCWRRRGHGRVSGTGFGDCHLDFMWGDQMKWGAFPEPENHGERWCILFKHLKCEASEDIGELPRGTSLNRLGTQKESGQGERDGTELEPEVTQGECAG